MRRYTVGPNTTTSAFVVTGSMPMKPPVAPLVSTHPEPAAVTSSTLTTRSATATLTTKTPQQTGSPRRAALTDQDTKTASAFTLITEAQTAAVPAPSTREAPSASLALSHAISQCTQLTARDAEDAVIAGQRNTSQPIDRQKNLQDMFAALIILYNRDEGGAFKPSGVKSVGEERDREMAKELQKKELDDYFKPRR